MISRGTGSERHIVHNADGKISLGLILFQVVVLRQDLAGGGKKAKELAYSVTIQNPQGKTADAKKIFAVMSLGVKNGETITVTLDGAGFEEASVALRAFMEDNV